MYGNVGDHATLDEWKYFTGNFEKDKPHGAFKAAIREKKLHENIQTSLKIGDYKYLRPQTKEDSLSVRSVKLAWKLPFAHETHDKLMLEANRFNELPNNKKLGRMFVCPPKAENIHQLLEEQRLNSKKQILQSYLNQSTQASVE